MTVQVKRRLLFETSNGEVIKECEVTVWQEAAEKGYGICPDYEASCGIESIISKGIDIASAWGSEHELDKLAEEIIKRDNDEAMEAIAINQFERKQEFLGEA